MALLDADISFKTGYLWVYKGIPKVCQDIPRVYEGAVGYPEVSQIQARYQVSMTCSLIIL